MSHNSTPDRETFQQILAGAFAVQASQIDREWLTVYVEIQRSVATGELNATEALKRIVASTRDVAGAAGVAIGLLQADHLIYRAGSGTAAADLNHRLTASLTASSDAIANREILRVENADEDPRIEAAICRQLEAKSVLILPICKQSELVGLFEVRFGEPHFFREPELRTYRLMASLVEEAVFHGSQVNQQVEQKVQQKAHQEDDVAALTVLPHDDEPEVMARAANSFNYASISSASGALYRHCETALSNLRKSVVLRQSASRIAALTANLATGTRQRAKGLAKFGLNRYDLTKIDFSKFLTKFDLSRLSHTSYNLTKYRNLTRAANRRNLALAGGVAVLGLTSWIAYRTDHKYRPATSASSPAMTRTIPDKQAALEYPKPPAANSTNSPFSMAVHAGGTKTFSREGRRVRGSENEIDYTRGDVTVRYFTTKPAPSPSLKPKSRVTHIGEDVTVRYFAPEAPLRPAAR